MYKARMSCLVWCIRCQTLSECDVIQTVCDVVSRLRVMTQISDCNVTCTVYMWPYIQDEVSYTEAVML